MDELVQLSMPWWMFALRAMLIYVFLLVLMRLSGKRTVGEFTPFDLIVLMLLSEAMQAGLVADDHSVLGPAITAVVLVALNYLVGFASARSQQFDKLVEGEPVVLVKNGRMLHDAMRRCNISDGEVTEAVRKHGLHNVHDVEVAMLETDGEITIIARHPKPGAADSGGHRVQ